MNTSQLKKGIKLSVTAQIVSLSVSVILNLIVPKYLGEYQYSYWQTFLLYLSYVGILHFGILDGIVLRYSQYNYEDLDKKTLRSQFLSLFIIDACISILFIIYSSLFLSGKTGQIVILVAFGIVTRNIFTYTSYIFQTTNRIHLYALLIITQRLFYGIGILILVFLNINNYIWFCIIDLLADVFGIILGTFFNKGLYFGSILSIHSLIKELISNISSGIQLLIANWSSQLLTGAAKMVVQWRWTTLVFGKLSFAFSVSALFLNFVSAVSVVLFPSLKRMNEEELPLLYKKIRDVISPLMFFSLLLYFPGCYLLKLWLPNYSNSLIYLGIMLPSIIFTSKVSLLTNNYLKAYRKEKSMLYINVSVMIVGFVLYLLCAYLFDNIYLLLLSLVIVIMARSIISEFIVMQLIKVFFYKDFIVETMITIIFILCTQFLTLLQGFFAFSITIIIYILVYPSYFDSFKKLLNRNFIHKK